MNNESNLPSKLNNDTSSIIKDTLLHLVEGITGIAASEKKELAFSVGHVFQSVRKGRLLSQLLNEWDSYKKKGRINDDYSESEQHFECLSDLLDFLDNDISDQTRFSLLKRIFITAATERVSDRNSLLPNQYMKICKTLSSGEAILMCAVYDRFKVIKPNDDTSKSAVDWISTMAQVSNLEHIELVKIFEDGLMNKQILTPRQNLDHSGVKVTPYYRLTNLGYEICKYIESYDSEE